MTSPEIYQPQLLLGSLPTDLDEATKYMSGGFEQLEAFQKIISYGMAAIPELLNTDQPDWWRLQAVWTIAAQFGDPVHYPAEVQGRYEPVTERTINWAKAGGYIVAKAK